MLTSLTSGIIVTPADLSKEFIADLRTFSTIKTNCSSCKLDIALASNFCAIYCAATIQVVKSLVVLVYWFDLFRHNV